MNSNHIPVRLRVTVFAIQQAEPDGFLWLEITEDLRPDCISHRKKNKLKKKQATLVNKQKKPAFTLMCSRVEVVRLVQEKDRATVLSRVDEIFELVPRCSDVLGLAWARDTVQHANLALFGFSETQTFLAHILLAKKLQCT